MIPGSKLFERISRTGDFCEDFFRRDHPGGPPNMVELVRKLTARHPIIIDPQIL